MNMLSGFITLDSSLRYINGAVDQLLCLRVCSGCILKLTLHGGSFLMLIYIWEALWTVPLLYKAWDTCEHFNCLRCPVIIIKCAWIKVHTLNLQRKKTWLILASTYRQRPLLGKVPGTQNKSGRQDQDLDHQAKTNFHQGLQCTRLFSCSNLYDSQSLLKNQCLAVY